jgi:hypothetical protein
MKPYIKILAIGIVTLIAGYILATPREIQDKPEPEPPLPKVLEPIQVEPIPPVPPVPKPAPLPKKKEPVPDGAICVEDCPLIEVEGEVRAYFKDEPVLIAIAECESKFRHWERQGVVLKNNQGSSATGVMQILESVHKEPANVLGYDIEDLHGNMAYARHLYEQQGTTPWNASIHCWSDLARL